MSNICSVGLELGIKTSKLDTRKREKRQPKENRNYTRAEPYKREANLKANKINFSDF
jgi:hypothetical protein